MIDIIFIDLSDDLVKEEFLAVQRYSSNSLPWGLNLLKDVCLLFMIPHKYAPDSSLTSTIMNYPFEDVLWWQEPVSQKFSFQAVEFFLRKNIEALKLRRKNSILVSENTCLNASIKNQRQNLKQTDTAFPYSFLTGNSSHILSCRKQILYASQIHSPVLLTGKVGFEQKEIANYIHNNSGRSERNFEFVSLYNVPIKLQEDRIFGRISGMEASGPNEQVDSPKKWTNRNVGTLFIEGIENLSWGLQTRMVDLLTRLETWNKRSNSKLQFLFAVSRNLNELLEAGIFRQDLISKLNVHLISIPTLRERDFDIVFILEQYLHWYQKQYSKNLVLTPALKLEIADRFFNKSITQLYSFLEKWLTLADSGLNDYLSLEHIEKLAGITDSIPTSMQKNTFIRENSEYEKPTLFSEFTLSGVFQPELENVEKMYIEHILKMRNGNIAKSSRILGISRKTLYKKIKTYNLKVS